MKKNIEKPLPLKNVCDSPDTHKQQLNKAMIKVYVEKISQ